MIMVMVMIMGSACVIFAGCTHDASLCSDWHKLCAASATGCLFILTYIYLCGDLIVSYACAEFTVPDDPLYIWMQ
jgi:hypothetical protein